ncbi:pH-dependent sodium/proton antiporter [Salinisphaera sp. PC39]|uniref:Na+/H+ antiporter NhaA n=1 Tax=Salinisphaera sp. PC39 TaxID=1304156 RepID=UPI00333ED961
MTAISLRARRERLAGLLTVAAMLLAFALANSPLEDLYRLIHHTPVSIQVGQFRIDRPLIIWINKGLMVFFFLLIGFEVKREILEGRLSDRKRIALPALAAVGGMTAPAAVYLALNAGTATTEGWAIPTATDIVLALAVLSLLRPRVPEMLIVFLTALAVFDDVGAILVIALFYSEGLSAPALALAGVGIAVLVALNRYKVIETIPYVLGGLFLWATVLKSGVHATLAGVVLAFAIPLRVPTAQGDVSPLRRMEDHLHPWVLLGVVPLFAFFNTGISVSGLTAEGLWTPVALGIILGLFLGKQLGIFGATWLAVRLGAGRLPPEVTWTQIYGVALLGGIGFTMSLFITSLAFEAPDALVSARSAILLGSALSAVTGLLVLHFGSFPRSAERQVSSTQGGQ